MILHHLLHFYTNLFLQTYKEFFVILFTKIIKIPNNYAL